MCRQNHGYAADYYALGVIVFECMMGRVSPRLFHSESKLKEPQNLLEKLLKL